MRVGLIDVDSHNFPNLCLMKLSEYHTRRGDRVNGGTLQSNMTLFIKAGYLQTPIPKTPYR